MSYFLQDCERPTATDSALSQLFGDVFNRNFFHDLFSNYEIRRSKNGIVARFNLAGFDHKDVKINFENGYVKIFAEKLESSKDGESNETAKSSKDEKSSEASEEKRKQSINFYVGDGKNFEKIDAKMKNGILEMNFKFKEKAEESSSKSIPVEQG
jgi:HSP20 family molecular chaperone IbpA